MSILESTDNQEEKGNFKRYLKAIKQNQMEMLTLKKYISKNYQMRVRIDWIE